MKTSNLLLLVLAAFICSTLIYDKISLNKQYDKFIKVLVLVNTPIQITMVLMPM